MRSLGLRLRIFLTTMGVIVGLLALTYVVMRSLVDRILEAEIENGLGRARLAHASFSDVRYAVLIDQARSVTQVPHLRAVLDTPDVDESTVGYTIASLGAAIDPSLLFVTDTSGRILAHTIASAPDQGRNPAIERGLAGQESCSIWEYAGEPYIVAVSPVTLEGTVLGLVGLGYRLELHARDLRRVTGLDVTVMRGERVLAAAWSSGSDAPDAVPPPSLDPAPWATLTTEGDSRLEVFEREYMATAVPLGEPGLELVLSRPLDDVLQHFQRARVELLLIGLLIAGVGLLASQWIASRIAGPIHALTKAAKSLARGELATEVDVRSEDEVGLLARAFNDMAEQLSALMQQTLEKARAAEQASEAKSVFLATMSHEIRTPLNGVLGFAEQIQASDLTSEQREYVGFIQRSGQDLLGIIDEILDFAKLEAGEMRLEETEFHLSSCLSRALDPLRPAIAAKELDLEVRIDEDVPQVLVGPASRLRQIVANYASNAVKFTARGSIGVHASKLGETEGDVLLRVSVQDTGIGITSDGRARLFKAFAQLDSGASREYGGTGLGLAICKELAGLMGGDAGVESAPGAGSTFWFTARLRKAQAAASREPAPRPKALLPSGGETEAVHRAPADPAARERRGKQRILVAEDNRINQRMTAVVLQKAGFSHAIAENGRQAVEKFAAETFDLILMDCQMPGLDGFEATRQIRALEQGSGRRVPILALTANAFEADRKACLAAGMDDFIAKPFEAAKLVDQVDRWLAIEARA
jgi:signal transduction histidine kinase/CheY-like chemotaxis protein